MSRGSVCWNVGLVGRYPGAHMHHFLIRCENRPGIFAPAAEVFARANANILYIHAEPLDEEVYIAISADFSEGGMSRSGLERSCLRSGGS